MQIKSLVFTCEGCPVQAEGELSNGDSFFFRERHGGWRFEVNGEVLFSGEGKECNIEWAERKIRTCIFEYSLIPLIERNE